MPKKPVTLAEYLKAAAVKQCDFAKDADLSEGYLSEIIRGLKTPGAHSARKISHATGGKVTLETLLFGVAA